MSVDKTTLSATTNSVPTYLICYGINIQLFEILAQIGERVGFSCLLCSTQEAVLDTLSRNDALAGVVIGDHEIFATFLESQLKSPLNVRSVEDIPQVLKKFDEYLTKGLPKKLITLSENTILHSSKQIFKNYMGSWERSLDFNLRFSHCSMCDSVAAEVFAKASCEINVKRIKLNFPEFAEKQDKQLMDMSGELCNQMLGIFNAALRKIGVQSLISLPVGVQMSESNKIFQNDFMRQVRLIDATQSVALGLLIKLDPRVEIKWDQLSDDLVFDEIDFL